eukprot:m.52059 g.52059  ORF g.52059 m.52059 type:complete len:590 (-) comp13478_c0_seq1:224-1993(-)
MARRHLAHQPGTASYGGPPAAAQPTYPPQQHQPYAQPPPSQPQHLGYHASQGPPSHGQYAYQQQGSPIPHRAAPPPPGPPPPGIPPYQAMPAHTLPHSYSNPQIPVANPQIPVAHPHTLPHSYSNPTVHGYSSPPTAGGHPPSHGYPAPPHQHAIPQQHPTLHHQPGNTMQQPIHHSAPPPSYAPPTTHQTLHHQNSISDGVSYHSFTYDAQHPRHPSISGPPPPVRHAQPGDSISVAHLSLHTAPGAVPLDVMMGAMQLDMDTTGATHGTVIPYDQFDPEVDAKVLLKAFKGMGCDRKTIIQIITHRSNAQRQAIRSTYKTMTGRDLMVRLKQEIGHRTGQTLLALLKAPAERDAEWLRQAMKGIGTNHAVLIEILCTRSPHDLDLIKVAYEKLHGRQLEDDVRRETGGHFKRLLVSLLQGNRPLDSAPVDEALAAREARELKKAGIDRWGTDESTFNRIFCTRSYPQLRQTFQEYNKIAKYNILESIKREMSSNLKHGMLALARCVSSKQDYFADVLRHSMKGLGTDESQLIRCVVSRAEIDMVEIKEQYFRKFQHSLEHDIRGDTSGFFRTTLLALVNGHSTESSA